MFVGLDESRTLNGDTRRTFTWKTEIGWQNQGVASRTFLRGNGTFTKWRGAEALAFRGK